MVNFYKIGKEIYNVGYWREAHRFIVFVARAYLNYGSLTDLYSFFLATPERRALIKNNKFYLEQATRAFFYKGSTFKERSQLIKNHFKILQSLIQNEWVQKFSQNQPYEIWRSTDAAVNWSAELKFETGQRKEGLLSVMMWFNGKALYQIMFWLNYDKNGEPSLYIGAMQGPNTENAKETVKETTKLAHRYRTKNLILYMTQAVARALGVKHIYAVANEGYYANNHVRRDRKLKTDFGAFWEEAGGKLTKDIRFYELPLTETRKTMEEVPTRKRAVYRKRFAFQDDVDAQIAAKLSLIMRNED